jgi:hypothetical protein
MVYQFTTWGPKPYKTFAFPVFFEMMLTAPTRSMSATVNKNLRRQAIEFRCQQIEDQTDFQSQSLDLPRF